MPTYEFETPRLYFQRLSIDEHLEDFWEIWRDPAALIWSTHNPKTTIEEAEEFMKVVLPNEENPDIDKFAILLKPQPQAPPPNPEPGVVSNEKESTQPKLKPKMVGFVGTNRWSPQGMEVGYCMNADYWGMGYGGEAFAAFLGYFWTVDERKDINHLVAKVDPANERSERIVRRVGGRRGELLLDVYGKGGMGGKAVGERKKQTDLRCWYLDREGWEVENKRVWEKRMEKEGQEKEG